MGKLDGKNRRYNRSNLGNGSRDSKIVCSGGSLRLHHRPSTGQADEAAHLIGSKCDWRKDASTSSLRVQD